MTTNTDDVIHAYTAKQAVEDGASVQFNPATALECGYGIPVIMTRAAYADAVEWTRDDDVQDADARFWDVLNMARRSAQAAMRDGEPHTFRVYRLANTTPSGRLSKAETATVTTLTIRAEGYDRTGSPCLVIGTPDED